MVFASNKQKKMSSSYQNEAELELGLGLSLHSGDNGDGGGHPAVRGKGKTWRDHDCGRAYSTSPGISQVVGWPPIRTQRMNSLTNQTNSANGDQEDYKGVRGNNANKDTLKKRSMINKNDRESGHVVGYVKVSMDGLGIGRKVNLTSHSCYDTLAQTIHNMFFKASTTIPSKLLDGSSEFVLTYEDKEGDWLLVGDVPWRMFLSTAKKLRIMKTSEANTQLGGI